MNAAETEATRFYPDDDEHSWTSDVVLEATGNGEVAEMVLEFVEGEFYLPPGPIFPRVATSLCKIGLWYFRVTPVGRLRVTMVTSPD